MNNVHYLAQKSPCVYRASYHFYSFFVCLLACTLGQYLSDSDFWFLDSDGCFSFLPWNLILVSDS
jgi:hypothetical protein